MTHDVATTDRPAPRTDPWAGRRLTGALAALVVADLLAFQWWLSYRVDVYQHLHDDVGSNPSFLLESDLSQPVTSGAWALVLLNGLLLVVPRQTRRAGVALLTAVGLLAGAVTLWWVGALATYAAGA